MSIFDFVMILFLILLVSTIAGLFTPSIFKLESRKSVLKYSSIAFSIWFVLLLIFAPREEKSQETESTNNTQSQPISEQTDSNQQQDKDATVSNNTSSQSVNSVQSPQINQPPKDSKQPENVSVTAKILIADYKENEVAADEKYKGKILTVTGVIEGVSNGTFDDEMIVRVSNGEQYSFDSVTCVANEREKVLALKKGDKITVEGIGDSATLGSPSLKNCAIR